MKIIGLLLFLPQLLWAKPIVLIGYFDPFDGAPFNNSEIVAQALLKRVALHPEYDLKLCELSTVFDKSYYQFEDCLKNLPEVPKLVLGLGESNCNFKIETMARNNDKTAGPDNEGNERINTSIIPHAPKELGFNYPLASMYCALNAKDRNSIEVSNNAGTFVCNNFSFQFSYHYPEMNFGFIHVPSHNCKNLVEKTQNSVDKLEEMIQAAVHSTESSRLMTKKKELEILRQKTFENKCYNEFYKRTKGSDEKGFWPF